MIVDGPEVQTEAAPVARPSLAVWKFASCDGCQLQVLSVGEDLLALAERVDVAMFLEASRGVVAGPYDISLVEGSITTPDDARRIQEVRAQSGLVVTIGACATAGGIQALRNLVDIDDLVTTVYAEPDYIDTLATSSAIADHITVDLELRGCPIEKGQLLEVLGALLHGRRPTVPTSSVCLECKRRGTPCIVVTEGTACLGPVTQAGCGARCPTHGRGCYGCFGPMETPATEALGDYFTEHLGVPRPELLRLYRTFNAGAVPFAEAAARLEDPS